MMTKMQRNVSLAIAVAFFGGYALLELHNGHGRSAYESSFLGLLICAAIFRVAQATKRPPAG
jgi:hypothetical protein